MSTFSFPTLRKAPGETGIGDALSAALSFMFGNVLRWLPAALLAIAIEIGAVLVGLPTFNIPMIVFSVFYLRLALAIARPGGVGGSLVERSFASWAAYIVAGLAVLAFFIPVVILAAVLVASIAATVGNLADSIDLSPAVAPDAVSELANSIASSPLAPVLIIVSLVALIAALYVGVRLSLASTGVVVEPVLGPVAGVKRSWRISRGSFWRIFGWSFVAGIVSLLLSIPVAVLTGVVMAFVVSASGLDKEMSTAISMIPTAFLVAPLTTGVLLVLYERLTGTAK